MRQKQEQQAADVFSSENFLLFSRSDATAHFHFAMS
jgi:hypothetical protein